MAHDPTLDNKYADLLGPQKQKGLLAGKLGKGLKRYGPGMAGWFLLEKLLSGRHESKVQDIQTQAARDTAGLQTPENLLLQASLPQAREEEAMAHSALLTQISGGVIGPTLARGERRIGGG